MADQAQEDIIVDADTPTDTPGDRNTGPLSKIRWPWGKKPSSGAAAPVPAGEDEEEEEGDFKRRRKLIETFSEDYLSWADRAKLATAKFIAFVLPVAAVAAVGTDIGAFFAPSLGTFSSYVLAYSIESGLAALTIMLGMAAQKTSEGVGHWVKVGISAAVWLIASLASGLVMYVIASDSLPAAQLHTNLGSAVILLRTFIVMLIDLMSVCILFFRGKSLQKYLHEMSMQTQAITETNEAELSMERAQRNAKQRQKEDDQYLEGKARQFEIVAQLTEMTNQALLDVARRNLLKSPDEGNNRRIGRY